MTGRVAQLIRALPRLRRQQLALLLVLMSLSALADGGTIVTLAYFLDGLSANGDSPVGRPLGLFAVLMLASGLLRIALTYCSQYVGHLSARDLVVAIHRNWLEQPYIFHLQRHSAQLLASPERVDQAVFGYLLPQMQALAAGLSMAGIVTALMLINAMPALVMLAALTFFFAMFGLAVRSFLYRHARAANRAYEDRMQAIQDSHGAIRDIIIGDSQPAHVDRFRQAADAVASAGIASATASALPRQLFEVAGIVATAGLAAYLSTTHGGLIAAVPMIGALALAGQRLLPAAQSLFQGWTAIRSAGPMVDDALTLLCLLPTAAPEESPQLQWRQSIALDGVTFAYPGSKAPAIRNVNLVIDRGERVVVTGPSGAGKSTLADIIMGLLTPYSGMICVDGKPCGSRQLRRLASHVPQSPYFADYTIAETIAGADQVELDRLYRAIELAGLQEVVSRLDKGLSSRLGEQAVRLSGGERQRIAFARAIYREAPLLILDEATSAVDDDTERQILGSLHRLEAEGVTIIIIAHRGGALAAGGRIVRLESGRIVTASAQFAPRLEHQD